ncbi:MAG: tetratricopeptide repeat protein [Planctomycetaceae bacterium]
MAHSSLSKEPVARRVLNLKALGILLAAGLGARTALGYLHDSQMARTRDLLKANADQALAEENHQRAFDLLEQFLGLSPGNAEAEEKISQLLEEHGTSNKELQRAFQINEKILRKDRTRDDVRLRQIRLADRLGQHADVAVHLGILREQRSDLADVWYYSGLVAEETGDRRSAIQYYQTAVALENPSAETYEHLARLLTSETGNTQAAEDLLQQLVNSRNSAETRRIRARWMLEQHRPQAAIGDLAEALRFEPDHEQTLAMMLKALRELPEKSSDVNRDAAYQSFINHLGQLLNEFPDRVRLRMYLSSALWSTGRRDAAIQTLEQGIARDPREFEMYEVLVDYLVSEKRYDQAQAVFTRIPERAVNRGRREFMRGRLLMSQKNWESAIEAFEVAMGYAHQDKDMASRARVCLALCRRETGDNMAAMETYRALIQNNPEFEGGRLGMASAYLRADQIDLAIAEYRQLLHVEGVPEFLANLMIRRNLQQPRQGHDWSEIENLLRDDRPLIRDVTQRILLKADLLFAKGFPAQAMDLLDDAARQMPDSPQIQRAQQRLAAVHGDQLLERVRGVLKNDPANPEAHLSILRLLASQPDAGQLTEWLQGLLNGNGHEVLDESRRLTILSQAATSVAESELSAHGSTAATEALLKFGGEAYRRLAAASPRGTFDYIRFLAMHQFPSEALNAAEAAEKNLNPELAGACWLECLRHASTDSAVRRRVDLALVTLIRQEPRNATLRLLYADSRILQSDYQQAEVLLNQLASFDRHSGRALGRLAWLALMIQRDPRKALQLSENATQLSPGDVEVRSIRGLALAENNQLQPALDVLTSIPDEDRPVASYLYEARAHALAGQQHEATVLIRKLSDRRLVGDLNSADLALLKQMQQLLQVRSSSMTSR